jgi:hypothetical protein
MPLIEGGNGFFLELGRRLSSELDRCSRIGEELGGMTNILVHYKTSYFATDTGILSNLYHWWERVVIT